MGGEGTESRKKDAKLIYLKVSSSFSRLLGSLNRSLCNCFRSSSTPSPPRPLSRCLTGLRPPPSDTGSSPPRRPSSRTCRCTGQLTWWETNIFGWSIHGTLSWNQIILFYTWCQDHSPPVSMDSENRSPGDTTPKILGLNYSVHRSYSLFKLAKNEVYYYTVL